MPYIPKEEKIKIDNTLGASIDSPGGLNYVITKLCHGYIGRYGLTYSNLNEIIGVLECAKLEFYRQVIVPYENVKKTENGNISELDA